MRLVLASNNAKKLAELQGLFEGLPLTLVTQGSLGIPEAEEPHATFVENALAKARHAAAACEGVVLADDSGLCVGALGGAPGVISAHYAGEVTAQGERETTRRLQDLANNRVLLERMAGVTDRRARFVSTLVALRWAGDPEPLVAVGRWEGEILGARGVGQHGDVVRRAGIQQLPEALGLLVMQFPTLCLHGLEGAQRRLLVRPHAGGVPVDDVLQQRQARQHGQPLVDLLLVLGEQADGLAVLEQVLRLVGRQVGIHRHDLAAQGLRRHFGPKMLGLVLADDRHRLPALDPQPVQPQRQRPDLVAHLRKAVLAPDAPMFVPLRQALRRLLGPLLQDLRQGRQLHRSPSPR